MTDGHDTRDRETGHMTGRGGQAVGDRQWVRDIVRKAAVENTDSIGLVFSPWIQQQSLEHRPTQ